MRKLTVFILALSLSFFTAYSQHGVENGFNVNVSGGGITNIRTIPHKKGETKGDVYMADTWSQGNVLLEDETVILDYPLKYNLKSKEIEIKIENEIKVAHYNTVNSFSWMSLNGVQNFEKASVYDKEIKGFLEVLADGEKIKLFSNAYLEILEANYNVTMNAGTNHDEYVKKEKLFVYKNETLTQIKKTKKSVLSVMKDKEAEVKIFAKSNGLKYRKSDDIVKMVNYYNSL